MSIKIKYEFEDWKYLIQRSSENEAGWDICASEATIVKSWSSTLVQTGVKMSMPPDIYCRIAPRSGLAYKNKLNVHAGVIDSSFRGSVGVILFNHSNDEYVIQVGDRVAQLIFTQLSTYAVENGVDTLDDTTRGDNGFGSSG